MCHERSQMQCNSASTVVRTPHREKIFLIYLLNSPKVFSRKSLRQHDFGLEPSNSQFVKISRSVPEWHSWPGIYRSRTFWELFSTKRSPRASVCDERALVTDERFLATEVFPHAQYHCCFMSLCILLWAHLANRVHVYCLFRFRVASRWPLSGKRRMSRSGLAATVISFEERWKNPKPFRDISGDRPFDSTRDASAASRQVVSFDFRRRILMKWVRCNTHETQGRFRSTTVKNRHKFLGNISFSL